MPIRIDDVVQPDDPRRERKRQFEVEPAFAIAVVRVDEDGVVLRCEPSADVAVGCYARYGR
jgi:hypothetical protein